ncbi:MAG TPA: hypothetical protein VEU98_10335 [Candidatus Eremiobacteraceae bacterium]|nr:hypothetical protein [Candidatus Eremiobacteraceae bacterium]
MRLFRGWRLREGRLRYKKRYGKAQGSEELGEERYFSWRLWARVKVHDLNPE